VWPVRKAGEPQPSLREWLGDDRLSDGDASVISQSWSRFIWTRGLQTWIPGFTILAGVSFKAQRDGGPTGWWSVPVSAAALAGWYCWWRWSSRQRFPEATLWIRTWPPFGRGNDLVSTWLAGLPRGLVPLGISEAGGLAALDPASSVSLRSLGGTVQLSVSPHGHLTRATVRIGNASTRFMARGRLGPPRTGCDRHRPGVGISDDIG
jgi:hypothetical protein